MLLFGPSLLYDVIITKTINEHEKGMRQYSYTVIPEPSQTKWLHQIPTTFWNKKDGGFKSSFDLIVHGGLSEEQVEAIADFQREYDGLLLNTIARTYLKPHGDDEVISLLSKNPLNQFALKDGIPIFGDKPELFVAAITEIADIKTLKSKEDLPKVEEETPGMPEEDVPLPQEPTETATAEVVNTEKISEPEPEDTKFPPDENTPKPKKSPFDEKADPEKEEKPIETTTKETNIDTSEVGDPWPQE